MMLLMSIMFSVLALDPTRRKGLHSSLGTYHHYSDPPRACSTPNDEIGLRNRVIIYKTNLIADMEATFVLMFAIVI